MKILGLDAALGGFSAAVTVDTELRACIEAPGNVALEQGLKIVRQVLDASGVQGRSLDRIAVGTGPGGFTGLRIAISYAKALAFAWGVPLVAASSFDTLELGRVSDQSVLAVVQGRLGVISARYRTPDGIRRASGRVGDVLDELLDTPPGALEVVNAPEDVLRALAERGFSVTSYHPAIAPAAAAIAALALTSAPAASVHEVRADYGELPAATPPKFAR